MAAPLNRTYTRARKHFVPQVEFTRDAYKVLDAAAAVVLKNMGLLQGGYVTKEDLISNAWLNTFMYVKKPEHVRTKLFVWAQLEMWRYIDRYVRPWNYVHIGSGDEADALMGTWDQDVVSDPETMALLTEALEGLPEQEKDILYRYYILGENCSQIAPRYGRCRERIRQILYQAEERLRDRYAGTEEHHRGTSRRRATGGCRRSRNFIR